MCSRIAPNLSRSETSNASDNFLCTPQLCANAKWAKHGWCSIAYPIYSWSLPDKIKVTWKKKVKQKGEQWRPRKDNSQLVSTIYRLGKSVYRERPATFPHMQNIKIHLWNASGVQPATSSSQHSCCLARARHLEFRSGWQPLCSTTTQMGGGGRGHGTRDEGLWIWGRGQRVEWRTMCRAAVSVCKGCCASQQSFAFSQQN